MRPSGESAGDTAESVKSVSCTGAVHISKRVDERGKEYVSDADDAAYATFELEGGVIAQLPPPNESASKC